MSDKPSASGSTFIIILLFVLGAANLGYNFYKMSQGDSMSVALEVTGIVAMLAAILLFIQRKQ